MRQLTLDLLSTRPIDSKVNHTGGDTRSGAIYFESMREDDQARLRMGVGPN